MPVTTTGMVSGLTALRGATACHQRPASLRSRSPRTVSHGRAFTTTGTRCSTSSGIDVPLPPKNPRSGGGSARPGFDRLLVAIWEGRVGIVLAAAASRLAGNGRDGHTLLEFCGLVNCLLADEEAVYHSRLPNEVGRVVKPVFIENERYAQRADLQQTIPVARVTGEPRDFQPHDHADVTEADVGDDPLEVGPLGLRRARDPQVIIDDHDPVGRPAERKGPPLRGVLPVAPAERRAPTALGARQRAVCRRRAGGALPDAAGGPEGGCLITSDSRSTTSDNISGP